MQRGELATTAMGIEAGISLFKTHHHCRREKMDDQQVISILCFMTKKAAVYQRQLELACNDFIVELLSIIFGTILHYIDLKPQMLFRTIYFFEGAEQS